MSKLVPPAKDEPGAVAASVSFVITPVKSGSYLSPAAVQRIQEHKPLLPGDLVEGLELEAVEVQPEESSDHVLLNEYQPPANVVRLKKLHEP